MVMFFACNRGYRRYHRALWRLFWSISGRCSGRRPQVMPAAKKKAILRHEYTMLGRGSSDGRVSEPLGVLTLPAMKLSAVQTADEENAQATSEEDGTDEAKTPKERRAAEELAERKRLATLDCVLVADHHRLQLISPDGDFCTALTGRPEGGEEQDAATAAQIAATALWLRPVGLALAPGGSGRDVFMADAGMTRVALLSLEGNGSVLATTPPLGLKKPHGLVFHEGMLFVSDVAGHQIAVFDAHLNRLFGWGTFGSEQGEFNSPQGICVMHSAVYVADSGNHRIQCFTARRGSIVRVFGGFGIAAGDFREPLGLAACPLGKGSGKKYALLVCEGQGRRLQLLTPVGEPLQILPLPGASRLCDASVNLARKLIFVTDAGANRVFALSFRFTAEGGSEEADQGSGANVDDLLQNTLMNLSAMKPEVQMSEEELSAWREELLQRCFVRWCEIPNEERALRARMEALVFRMRRRTEILVIQEWHRYTKRARQMVKKGASQWLRKELAIGFRTWFENVDLRNKATERAELLFNQSAEYMPKAKLFNGFFEWVRYTLLKLQAAREADRRSVEQAISVAELELVWGCPLSTYPEPDSSAHCDECSRQTYRFYHVATGPGGIDLCESCYFGGHMTRQMAPEVRSSFSLVAPLIDAKEAWRDIAERERQITQAAYASQAADAQQKRSEAQFAARLFAAAAASAVAPAEARVVVAAQFRWVALQQASVPLRSRAAMLGSRDPSLLGDEVLRVVGEMRNATSLAALQLAVKANFMVAMDSDAEFEEADAPRPKLQPPMPAANPMQNMMKRYCSAVRPAATQEGQAFASVANAAQFQRSEAAQASREAVNILQQVGSTIAGVSRADQVQVKVQFGEAAAVPLSVPRGSKAEALEPAALGSMLVDVTRRAPSVAACKNALNALLLPPAKVAVVDL